MPPAIGRVLKFLRDKQVLHRLGVALSITVIAVACYVLYHILRDINVEKVLDAISQIDNRAIVMAGIAVACGYFTLTFYDLFALYAIGRRDVPYRIKALAAFTSYSVGHNVGASAFTGGAVRYRIYSGWDVNAIEVAKVCFLAGLTFWLGNIAVLGIGVAYHPEAASAIDLLPPAVNRVLAFVILAALVIYVAWVWVQPRRVGRGSWTVDLPDGPLTLLQIGIGIVDLTFCALAMYMLVPAEPDLGFPVVAVVFVTATLLGFASHSPGGLGVFDAAMLVGLSQMDKEGLLAGMLLFRLLYYIVPFIIAVLLLTAREALISARGRRAAPGAVIKPPLVNSEPPG